MLTLFALVATWLLLSGHYTTGEPLIAAFGVFSCGVVFLMIRRMHAATGTRLSRTLGLKTLVYLPWLLWQIVLANLQVARIILDPKLPISPCLVRVKASQRGDVAQVLYANSITLTPGTISLDIRDGTISVHAISEEIAEGLVSGEMDRKVSWTERAP